MAALTKERDTRAKHFDYVESQGVATNVIIYNGALVGKSATGYLIPAADTASIRILGRAQRTVNTTASGPKGVLADGVEKLEVCEGIFHYNNPAGGNALTVADVLAYVLSDNEVCRAAGTTNSRIAGRIVEIAADGVWIDTRVKA